MTNVIYAPCSVCLTEFIISCSILGSRVTTVVISPSEKYVLEMARFNRCLTYSVNTSVDVNQGGDLLDRVVMIRRQIALELGAVVPIIRLRDNIQLNPNQYIIKIKGIQISEGEILFDHYMAMNPGYVENNTITKLQFNGVNLKQGIDIFMSSNLICLYFFFLYFILNCCNLFRMLQIPSMLISVATGILVTKASKSDNIGDLMIGQLFYL